METTEVSTAAEGTKHSLGSVGGEASMEERGETDPEVKGGGGPDNGGPSGGVGEFETSVVL